MSGRGAERILDLLELFSASSEALYVSSIAKMLDMPKSSTSLLLKLLEERGYIIRTDNNGFVSHHMPGSISAGAVAPSTLLTLAESILLRSVVQSGESLFIAVLQRYKVCYLNKLLPQREIVYDRNISVLRHTHKVASGIVLMCERTDAEIDSYCDANRLSKQEAQDFRAKLCIAKEQGFYFNPNGVVEGAAGIAAPIRNTRSDIIAAVNISGPRERFVSSAHNLEKIVVAAAKDISTAIADAV